MHYGSVAVLLFGG